MSAKWITSILVALIFALIVLVFNENLKELFKTWGWNTLFVSYWQRWQSKLHLANLRVLALIGLGIAAVGSAAVVIAIPEFHDRLLRSTPPDQSVNKKVKTRADTLQKEAINLRSAGQNSQARANFNDARSLYHEIGDTLGEASVLFELGDLETKLGRNDQARADFDDARSLFQQVGDKLGEANVLRGLGDLEAALRRNDQARADYNDARSLYHQIGNAHGEANVLGGR